MKIPMLCLLITAGTCTNAQDTHYWNSQYGPGGFFLPGATIAYNLDSGVYFYNPALLSKSFKSTISLNAVLYQSQYIKLKDGAGTGKDLKSRNNASVPQMVAGSIRIGKKGFPIAYALIHTPGINFTASQRRDEKFQVLADYYSPGTEYFVGQYVIQNRVSETRAQLSSGFKINDKFSAGVLLEANVHNQYYNLDFSGRALVNPGIVDFPLVSSDAHYLADYSSIGIRPRLGIAYDEGEHHLGLTVTSPLMHIGGRGTIVSDNVLNNIKLSEFTNPLGLLASTRQEKLPVKWKLPLSIGAGYLYEYNKGQLYFAAEYFSKVKEYDILAPRNEFFIRPDTGTNNLFTYSLLRLKDVRKAIINFSIANRFSINKSTLGYICLRTDFSYMDRSLFKDADGLIPYTAYWDNYDLQFGVNKKTIKRNLKVGIFLTYGSTGSDKQEVNFDNPNESNVLQGIPVNIKATHFTAGLMLSYIYNL